MLAVGKIEHNKEESNFSWNENTTNLQAWRVHSVLFYSAIIFLFSYLSDYPCRNLPSLVKTISSLMWTMSPFLLRTLRPQVTFVTLLVASQTPWNTQRYWIGFPFGPFPEPLLWEWLTKHQLEQAGWALSFLLMVSMWKHQECKYNVISLCRQIALHIMQPLSSVIHKASNIAVHVSIMAHDR